MSVKLIITGEEYTDIIDNVLAHAPLTIDNVMESANQYICFMYFPNIDSIINPISIESIWDADNHQIIAEIIPT